MARPLTRAKYFADTSIVQEVVILRWNDATSNNKNVTKTHENDTNCFVGPEKLC